MKIKMPKTISEHPYKTGAIALAGAGAIYFFGIKWIMMLGFLAMLYIATTEQDGKELLKGGDK